MPKLPPFKPKQTLDKLPLAVRKDIRDKFDARKEDFEKEIADFLGKSFVINFNPNEIWAYNPEGSSFSAGNMLSGYAEGFISSLRTFLDKYDDYGKDYFNDAVTKSELTVNVNELGDKAPTISADIKDGAFRILFKHDSLGYNQSYLSDCILAAIENVPRQGFSLVAKTSIEKDWNSDVEDITAEISEILALPDVLLDPNFEENFKALSAKEDKSWQAHFGRTTADYFRDGLKYQLERQGFKGDDMLQEGLQEVLTSKTFKLRIVPKLKTGYNECAIEGGVAYLQTTTDNWAYNVGDIASGFVNLL